MVSNISSFNPVMGMAMSAPVNTVQNINTPLSSPASTLSAPASQTDAGGDPMAVMAQMLQSIGEIFKMLLDNIGNQSNADVTTPAYPLPEPPAADASGAGQCNSQYYGMSYAAPVVAAPIATPLAAAAPAVAQPVPAAVPLAASEGQSVAETAAVASSVPVTAQAPVASVSASPVAQSNNELASILGRG